MIGYSTGRRICTIFILVVIIVGPGLHFYRTEAARAQARGPIILKGRMINGTSGGEVPTGIQVELHVFDDTGQTSIYTQTLASDDSFSFNDVDLGPENQFLVTTTYQGVNYISRSGTVSNEGLDDIELRIYETTEDRTNVYVEQAHIFVVPDGERLHIAEVYSVSNSGDRTYVGEQTALTDRATLTFTLSSEVKNVEGTDSSLRKHILNDGVILMHRYPIIPGNATDEISFRYERPYYEGMRVNRELPVPLESALVLLQGTALEAKGEALNFNGTLETQMGDSISYLAGPLASNEELVFSIASRQRSEAREDAESPATSTISGIQAWEVLLGISVLAVAGLATFAMWESGPVPKVPETLRPLLIEIAELDLAYRNGEIEEAAYRTRRAALKQSIKIHFDQSDT